MAGNPRRRETPELRDTLAEQMPAVAGVDAQTQFIRHAHPVEEALVKNNKRLKSEGVVIQKVAEI